MDRELKWNKELPGHCFFVATIDRKLIFGGLGPETLKALAEPHTAVGFRNFSLTFSSFCVVWIVDQELRTFLSDFSKGVSIWKSTASYLWC